MADLKNTVFLDFETKSRVDLSQGAAAYAAHNSTEILLVSYAIENQPVITTDNVKADNENLKSLFDSVAKGFDIVAHNMLFEIFIWKYVARKKYNWPGGRLDQWLCTMQMCGRAGLSPLSLEQAGEFFGLNQKLSQGKHLIKFFCQPSTLGVFHNMDNYPDEKVKFMEYNAVDVEVVRDIYENLPAFKPHERKEILLDLKSNLYGVPVDVELSKNILQNCKSEQDKFGDVASKLTGGVITKLTQVQRLKNWVNTHNGSFRVDNCAADTIEDVLSNNRDLIDDTTAKLLEMRQHSGKSSTSKYERYSLGAVDGKVMGMIISFGAHTHRTVSKLLNLNNLPKPSVKYESMDVLVDDLKNLSVSQINEKYGSYLKAASTAIRGMIRAPEGMKLNVADYAGIEARLVFWSTDCKRGLKTYLSGKDPYIDISTVIFGVDYDNVTSDQRWVGKSCVLGAGFGLGWKGFQATCERYERSLSDDLCQNTIGAYRESYPEVVKAWDALETSAKLAIESKEITYALNGRCAFKLIKSKAGLTFLLMRKPSGSFMMYPSPKIEDGVTPWGAVKPMITYKKLKHNRVWIREYTYGGSIFENFIQSTARDIMYAGAMKASEDGFHILFSVYDEVIGLASEDRSLADFEKALCFLPSWADGFPVETEGKQTMHYEKI